MKTLASSLVFAVIFAGSAGAQEKDALDTMSLSDFLNIKTTVASGSKSKSLTPRESPGVISVITEDDIRKSGARDLVDVLRLVPGFSIQSGADNSGTIGPSIRGLKAAEGKMQLNVNGFSFVDLSYVNAQIFNRFPIDQIKQIEIIRGPGSATYGGHAELTVINVALKDGAALAGTQIGGIYSQMSKARGRQNLSVAHGYDIGGSNFSINAFAGNANLSDRDFVDEAGLAYRYDDETEFASRFLSVNSTHQNLTTRFMYNEYSSLNTDNYWGAINAAYVMRFTNLMASASYDYKALDGRLVITPSFDVNRNGAWNVTEEWVRPAGFWNEDTFVRYKAMLTALYRIDDTYDLLLGMENAHTDSRFHQDTSGTTIDAIVDDSHYYSNLGLFAQTTAKWGSGTFTLGGRYESTTASEKDALVPRVAYTYVKDRWHFKLLWAQAFRTPSGTQYFFKQIPEIKPELTDTKEIEVGQKLSESTYLTFNIFDTVVYRPLRYDNQGYNNMADFGSRGGELEVRTIGSFGKLGGSLSYYQATKRGYAKQASSLDDKAFIGQPRHKVTIDGTWNLGQEWFLSPSVIYEGKVYVATSNAFETIPEDEKNWTILNLYLLHTSAFGTKGLDVGVGGYNLLDQDILFSNTDNVDQPRPLPGPSREFYVKVTYNF